MIGSTTSADFITRPDAFQRLLGNPPNYYKMDSVICKIINVSCN
jgi:hypothetical protein